MSRYISSKPISGLRSATSSQHLRNKPSDILLPKTFTKVKRGQQFDLTLRTPATITKSYSLKLIKSCKTALSLKASVFQMQLISYCTSAPFKNKNNSWLCHSTRDNNTIAVIMATTNMMLALCTAVTLCLLLSLANLKAYSATLMEAFSVMSFMLWTTPSTI